MEEVLVSVVIPTYSRNITLVRAIESVLSQTYKNIEIIVVDDNPKESEWRQDTEKIMQNYKDNSSILYVQNEENLGGGLTRNNGIENSKGKYIAFLDDDDFFEKDKIEKMVNCFEKSNNSRLALVYTFAKFIDNSGNHIYSDKRNYNGCCLYEAMEQNCIAATSQWMVLKSAIDEVGRFPDVPCKQDSQTILRLLKADYEVECVPEELSIYNVSRVGSRISGYKEKNIYGEMLYREECRKLYYRLEDWQILNVEYKFAEMLYNMYRFNNKKELYSHEFEIMKQISPKRAYIYELKRIWHKIKK